MHVMTAAGCTTVLVLGLALCGGCKKENAQKTEAPQATTTAPAPAPAPEQAPAAATTPAQQGKSGEALFNERCASCHPKGGNVMKPDRTLNGKSLAAHNITTPEDIVKVMRNPGPGMTKFDQAALSDQDATAIAQYIQATFK